MHGPQASGGGVIVGGGPRGDVSRLWTPARIGASLLGWMDPQRADLLTLVSGNADSLLDAGPAGVTWTAPTGARRPPVIDGTDSRKALRLTNAGNHTLSTASGGVSGAAPHAIYWLGRYTDPTTSTFGSIATIGRSTGSSILGQWDKGYWGGGAGIAAPIGGTLDSSLHVFSKTYDGTTAALRVDGEALFEQAISLNVGAGSGLLPYDGGAAHTASADVYAVLFLSGAPPARGPHSLSWEIESYFGRIMPSCRQPTKLCFAGDSLTKPSSGLTTAQMWPTVAKDLLLSGYAKSVSITNAGNAGFRTDEILPLLPTTIDPYWTPLHRSEVFFAEGGVNDIIKVGAVVSNATADATAAAVLANLTAMVTARQTGYGIARFVAMTLPMSSLYDAFMLRARSAINAGIAAMAAASGGSIRVLDVGARPEFQTPGNATYFLDGTHFTVLSAAIVAQMAADLVADWVV